MTAIDYSTVRVALKKVNERLQVEHPVEILVVGGAAVLLMGNLPGTRTTADIDVIDCRRPGDRDAVFEAADRVGRELELPPSWISEDARLYAWTLPPNWERRRVLAESFSRLKVYIPGRADLIAMKFMAHRPGDLEHLELMRVTAQELNSVRRYLASKEQEYPREIGRIQMARQYADNWKVQ